MKSSRRTFLSTALAGASITLSEACGLVIMPGGALAQPAASFRGNPNVTITAVDTSGGIAMSRDAGKIPAFVQVSASAITASGKAAAGVIAPYQDLEYVWDFGDPDGTEIFTNPVTGSEVNANNGQTGPEAAYCYRTPGTKRITLTIRGQNGGTFTTASATATFNAAPFSPSRQWWFAVPSSGTGDGSSPANASSSLARLQEKLGISGSHCHLKRGSKFSGTSGLQSIVNAVNGLRVDAYGEGPNPVIEIQSGGGSGYYFGNSAGGGAIKPKIDIVISNLDFNIVGPGSGGAIYVDRSAIGNENSIYDFYLDRCNFTTSDAKGGNSDTLNLGANLRAGMWGGSAIGSQTPGTGHRSGVNGTPLEWFFLYGVNISGAGTFSVNDHHVYTDTDRHMVIRWVKLGNGPSRNLGLKLRPHGRLGLESPFVLVSDCEISGVQFGIGPGNASNSRGDFPYPDLAHKGEQCGRFTDILFQDNAFHDLRGAIYLGSTASATIRDNLLWNTPSRLCTPGLDLYDIFVGKVYRNKVYANRPDAIVITYSFSKSPWITPQVITDNVFYFTSGAATIMSFIFSEFKSNGSIVDRNQYWVPNDVDKRFLLNNSMPVAFGPPRSSGTWQSLGFDLNGSIADPKWIDPENGNFKT